MIDQCTQCHALENYVKFGHGKAVLQGNQDSATCSDCHGLHDTPTYRRDSAESIIAAREDHTKKCLKCHQDQAMMRRNHVSLTAASNYEETYHGKIRNLGYPYRVAGCPDCHKGHNILPKADPRSTIYPDNLVRNCGACHKHIRKRFTAFIAHPDPYDRAHYPVLYWTSIFMIGLLVAVFVFFWLHTVLWWRRIYWDLCQIRIAGLAINPLSVACDDARYVERFALKQRIMHILLILSFFTLVMTGFPLKYHDTAWAKVMVNLWGGAMQAGIFHRTAATLLSALFLYTVLLSIKYLFPKGVGKEGWIGRLLGPDSLCPNLKDWEDMKGMFRWFFNRGTMPKFERWTYWEKFDFFAVFLGNVCHRSFRAHTLVPGIVLIHYARMDDKRRYRCPF